MVSKTTAPWVKKRLIRNILTNYQIADEIGRRCGIGRAKGYKALFAFYSALAKGLREDGTVSLHGLGRFRTWEIRGRTGLEPRWPHYSTPKKVPSFRASPQLKALVNRDEEAGS